MATKTLGLSGRDYSTFAAYATYVNALTFSANEICDVYNDGGAVADTAQVTISGYTASSYTLTIRAASGQGFGDNANKLTNALRYNASNGAALTNSIGYANAYQFTGANITLQGLQFRASATAASSVAMMQNSARANNCIFYKSGGGAYVIVQGGSGMRLDDCLLIHGGATGGGIQCGATSLILNNCTFAAFSSSGKGFASAYSNSPVVKNTVFFGFTTGVESTAGAGTTNNALSNASFGGTDWSTSGQVSVSSSDFENVTSGTEDFRIKAGSTKLIDLGAGSVGTGFDVVGTTRGATYDIGAWEYSAAGPVLSGSATLGDITASGGMSVSTSDVSGSATLGDITAAGTLAQATGTITSQAFKNNTGTVLPAITVPKVACIRLSDMVMVLSLTNQVTDGSGQLVITSTSLVTGVQYLLVTSDAGAVNFGCEPYTAT